MRPLQINVDRCECRRSSSKRSYGRCMQLGESMFECFDEEGAGYLEQFGDV